MTTTNHLALTLVEQAQAQKEVTVNAALSRLDALLNMGAVDKDLATPPGSPTAGDVYIVAASPTGAWAGQAKKIAYFDQSWNFISPREGLTLWVNDENVLYSYDGTNWVLSVPASGATGTVTSVSVTTANGVSGTVATATTTPAISISLGAITPSSVAATGTVAGSNLSGTNTGDQTITLTGDVTGTGTGSFATTIGAGKVTNAMLAGSIDLTSKVTGALPIANGGTGATTAQAAQAALKGPYILAASAVASSVTGTATETTLATITLPANSMGANGIVRVITAWTHTNSANNKTLRMKFGGTSYLNSNVTTNATSRVETQISNRNATGSQVGHSPSATASFSSSGSAIVTSAVDTTASVTLLITGQLATTSETITLESYIVEVLVP